MNGLTFNTEKYSRAGMEKLRKLSTEEFNRLRKNCYYKFQMSWDPVIGGKMTESRFYAGTSHLKYAEDWKAIFAHADWCRQKGVPFAPYFYKKFFQKYEKRTTTSTG